MTIYKEITMEQAQELYLLGIIFQYCFQDKDWKIWAEGYTTPADRSYGPLEDEDAVDISRQSRFRVEVEE